MTNSDDLMSEQRLLPGYTGKPLNDLAWELYEALIPLGFTIKATDHSNNEKALTVRIEYRTVHVGNMHSDLWGSKKGPWTMLYRFPGERGAKVPAGFNREAFAAAHAINPENVFAKPENQGNAHYLIVKGIETAVKLMKDWAHYIDGDVLSQTEEGSDAALPIELGKIAASDESHERKQVLMDARMGQGKYRDDLLKEFDGTCVVTRLTVVGVLRASHIVPYSKSELREQTDPKNGLLLAANVDALFDRYLITFDPDGTLRCSFTLLKHDLASLGPMGNLLTVPCETRATYLRRHNAEFEEREAKRADLTRRA